MTTPSDADGPGPRGISDLRPPAPVTPPPARSVSVSEAGRPPMPRFRVGHVIRGKYRLERMIAKGGMGCVYLADQIPLGRPVAVKILIPQSYDDEFRRRFLLEASINAKLTHRHIVTVHDYGETEEGHLFMAMEYLDGEPLSRTINREIRLSPERACLIGIQIARALRFAHRAGVVHRDLKPSNVMLLKDEEEGLISDFAKVLDFGLVKVFEDNEHRARSEELELTRAGTMLGSPRYMAPEQIRCQPVDPRTDIYSLGIILFHMLAGRPPFIGQGSVEILNQHLRTSSPAIGDVAGDDRCPLELEVITERCLRKRPTDRYPSMEELLSELKAAYRLIAELPVRPSESYAEDLRLPSMATESVTPSRVFDPGSGTSLEQILTGELTPAIRVEFREGSEALPFTESDPLPEALDFRPRRAPVLLVLLALVLGGFGLALLGNRSAFPPVLVPSSPDPKPEASTLAPASPKPQNSPTRLPSSASEAVPPRSRLRRSAPGPKQASPQPRPNRRTVRPQKAPSAEAERAASSSPPSAPASPAPSPESAPQAPKAPSKAPKAASKAPKAASKAPKAPSLVVDEGARKVEARREVPIVD